MILVWTQFGPVPRNVLEVKDEVRETERAREVVTTWTLKEQITLKLPHDVEAVNSDGSKQTMKSGDFVTLLPGQFMRNSYTVDSLMPIEMKGEQFQK